MNLIITAIVLVAAVSLSVRLREDTDKEEYDEVTVDTIDEYKTKRTLVNGIKKSNPKGFKQYSVLCLVPITLTKPTYDQLFNIKFCTDTVPLLPYPSGDGQTHSEDNLFKKHLDVLKKNYAKNADFQGKHYDIFLFSENSPWPRCAQAIVDAVKSMNGDVLFDGFYVSYNKLYANKQGPGASTLAETRRIITAYNNETNTAKRITLLPEYHASAELGQYFDEK